MPPMAVKTRRPEYQEDKPARRAVADDEVTTDSKPEPPRATTKPPSTRTSTHASASPRSEEPEPTSPSPSSSASRRRRATMPQKRVPTPTPSEPRADPRTPCPSASRLSPTRPFDSSYDPEDYFDYYDHDYAGVDFNEEYNYSK
ncbi:unnamed protein product [Urochloa humidicola]